MLTLIMFCVIISFIVVLYRFAKDKNIIIEGLSSSITTQGASPGSTDKEVYKGTFNSTFNGRMAINDMEFYDKLFDDVVYYSNEYKNNESMGDLVATGWEKCKLECTGHCVEYGLSGNSFCFSY